MGDRIEAAGAWHFEVALVGRAQTDVVNQIVGPAMLGEQVGAAAHRHAVQLPNAGAVIDGAGGNGVAEFKRLPFQIEHGYQYGHGISHSDWMMISAVRCSLFTAASPVVSSGSKVIIDAEVRLQGVSQRMGVDRNLVK